MGVLLDSSFVIDILRRIERALTMAAELDDSNEEVFIPVPVLYEVRIGLVRENARAQEARFAALAQRFTTLPFDVPAAEKAAGISAEMSRAGHPVGAVDAMIGGMALVRGDDIVTRDRDHDRIAEAFGLRIRRY